MLLVLLLPTTRPGHPSYLHQIIHACESTRLVHNHVKDTNKRPSVCWTTIKIALVNDVEETTNINSTVRVFAKILSYLSRKAPRTSPIRAHSPADGVPIKLVWPESSWPIFRWAYFPHHNSNADCRVVNRIQRRVRLLAELLIKICKNKFEWQILCAETPAFYMELFLVLQTVKLIIFLNKIQHRFMDNA